MADADTITKTGIAQPFSSLKIQITSDKQMFLIFLIWSISDLLTVQLTCSILYSLVCSNSVLQNPSVYIDLHTLPNFCSMKCSNKPYLILIIPILLNLNFFSLSSQFHKQLIKTLFLLLNFSPMSLFLHWLLNWLLGSLIWPDCVIHYSYRIPSLPTRSSAQLLIIQCVQGVSK